MYDFEFLNYETIKKYAILSIVCMSLLVIVLYYEIQLDSTSAKEYEVAFLGDSYFEYLKSTKLWKDEFEKLNVTNFGLAGDTVDGLQMRLNNGLLEDIRAKIIVILIGTNSILKPTDDPNKVAQKIYNIALDCKKRQPNSNIIVLSIPPKRQQPVFRAVIGKVNNKVQELIEKNINRNIMYIKCDTHLIDPINGLLNADDYDSNFFHLSENGYKKFFEPLLSTLKIYL